MLLEELKKEREEVDFSFLLLLMEVKNKAVGVMEGLGMMRIYFFRRHPCHSLRKSGILSSLWRDVREVEGESLESVVLMW